MVPDKLITADCHIAPPYELINELPESYREYFPRIEKDEGGAPGQHRRKRRSLTFARRQVARVAAGNFGQAELLENDFGRVGFAGAVEGHGHLIAQGGAVQQGGRVLGQVGDPAGSSLDGAFER